MPEPTLLEETIDWLRIPSISAGARDERALRDAAMWAARRIEAIGGEARLEETPGGAPLVTGELRATDADAPTILAYGHYDVQDPGDPAAWTTPAFEPDVRDGRIYARGACDDKGNFLPLLHEACAMARAGELPVHVRFLIEGAEETGSAQDVTEWVEDDERGADAVIVFDSGMVDARTPALTVATRGVAFAHLTVTTGTASAHSGVHGGAALNAFHALQQGLSAVLAGPDGRLPVPLQAGVLPVSQAERDGWAALPDAAAALAEAGVRPADTRAVAEYYERTTALPSLDVHKIAGGDARTIVVPRCEADLSVRLAPGQDPAAIADALTGLLRDALPAGAELEIDFELARPFHTDPDQPALVAARRALAQAAGVEPIVVRSGGTLPILAAFADRGIPAIVSGFSLGDDNMHAPDESYRLSSLELGARAARALYSELGAALR